MQDKEFAMTFAEIYLTLVVAAFSTFALTLGGVGVWTQLGGKAN